MNQEKIRKQVYEIRELLFNLKDDLMKTHYLNNQDLLELVNETISKFADYE